MKQKIIVILGPTAVGKTALGIELAQLFNGEIISGDSQQVYTGLDIGTAKATASERAAARHHLLDVRQVDETYSAFDFVTEAQTAIADISSRGKLPIIVGGTGLYLQSLIEGYHLGGQVDQEAVLAYRQELDSLTDQELVTLVEQADLEVKQVNRRRAIRALELAKLSQGAENRPLDQDFLLIGLNDERSVLYERINGRVDDMMAKGLLEEARQLYDSHPQAQATRGIGYKEFFPYFAGQIDLETAIDQVKQNSRRFAKRQLTWFKNRMAVDFYSVSQVNYKEQVIAAIQVFLSKDS